MRVEDFNVENLLMNQIFKMLKRGGQQIMESKGSLVVIDLELASLAHIVSYVYYVAYKGMHLVIIVNFQIVQSVEFLLDCSH